jgi:hypothetical protein
VYGVCRNGGRGARVSCSGDARGAGRHGVDVTGRESAAVRAGGARGGRAAFFLASVDQGSGSGCYSIWNSSNITCQAHLLSDL